jgi:hypothetical protein
MNMPRIPIGTNHAFVIKSENMVENLPHFHWMKLQSSEILEVQFKWH